MRPLILLTSLSFVLLACTNSGTYPVSGCSSSENYPVTCLSQQSEDPVHALHSAQFTSLARFSSN